MWTQRRHNIHWTNSQGADPAVHIPKKGMSGWGHTRPWFLPLCHPTCRRCWEHSSGTGILLLPENVLVRPELSWRRLLTKATVSARGLVLFRQVNKLNTGPLKEAGGSAFKDDGSDFSAVVVVPWTPLRWILSSREHNGGIERAWGLIGWVVGGLTKLYGAKSSFLWWLIM